MLGILMVNKMVVKYCKCGEPIFGSFMKFKFKGKELCFNCYIKKLEFQKVKKHLKGYTMEK